MQKVEKNKCGIGEINKNLTFENNPIKIAKETEARQRNKIEAF